MPPQIEAIPNPELLEWARRSAGIPLLAAVDHLGVSAGDLVAWETGQARPTVAQLRRLAAFYKRPLAVFYLPAPPKTFVPMHDFRRVPGAMTSESPELLLEIRRASSRRDVAIELVELLQRDTPHIPISAALRDDSEDVAIRIREWLGVTAAVQTDIGWRGEFGMFRQWRDIVEAQDVLVFQSVGVEMSQMRGFSIAESPIPAIVVNIKDAPRGRVFTMMHELAHVLLRESSLCDLDDVQVGEDRKTEDFCNRVAAAVLVPASELSVHDVVLKHERGEARWTSRELGRLARYFGGASPEAILLRLLTVGLTTEEFYREQRQHFLARYARRQASQRERESAGGLAPHRLAALSAGKMFTTLVLEGYARDQIDFQRRGRFSRDPAKASR